MSRRKSIHVETYKHANPIPAASRIGNIVATGIISSRDPATGKFAPTLDEQCAVMFGHIKSIIEAAGGTTGDILKLNVWMKDPSQRAQVNEHWLKMFPDEHSRPARQTMRADLDGGQLVQCDFLAVVS
jgi:2-iminobutanoate/2-iminopropanoate deaminase